MDNVNQPLKPLFKITRKKNRGKIKSQIPNKKNREKHDKYEIGNVLIKIQVHCFKFLINFINDLIKQAFQKKNHNIKKFKQISYAIKKNINRENIRELKATQIKVILQKEISLKGQNDKNYNKNIYDKINGLIENDSTLNWINDIFEMKTKPKFPDQKIFRLNSLILNEEKEEKEIYTKYDCIYNKKDNSLYLLFNKNMNYSEFTKDKLINILDFSNSVKIDTIYILINKSNKYFVNIIQDMLVVGFEFRKNYPLFTIDGNIYKALKMSLKDIKQDIIQIELI